MNKRLFNINILDHPTNINITVFFFTQSSHSEYFKQLLISEGISFEFDEDESEGKFYFGIGNRNLDQVRKLNYLVFAKFRQPFISYAPAKYFLIGLTLLFLILAFVGYLKQ